MDEDNRTYHKGAFWQVTFPIVLGSIAILGLVVWAAIGAAGGADVSRFADISVVILIIPAMLFSLLPLALLAGVIYGLFRLLHILPKGMRRVRAFLGRVHDGVVTFSAKTVEPILRVKSAWVGLKSVFRKGK